MSSGQVRLLLVDDTPRSRARQAGLISREAPDDVVTGVANRWGFDESLERKWPP